MFAQRARASYLCLLLYKEVFGYLMYIRSMVQPKYEEQVLVGCLVFLWNITNKSKGRHERIKQCFIRRRTTSFYVSDCSSRSSLFRITTSNSQEGLVYVCPRGPWTSTILLQEDTESLGRERWRRVKRANLYTTEKDR